MKKAAVAEVKSKLLKTDEDGNVLFSHWRMKTLSSLFIDDLIGSVNDATVNIFQDIDRLFLRNYALEVLHAFIRYVLVAEADPVRLLGYVESSIVTLAG